MKKRLFSMLLSICMVFTMIPMAGGGVFAETATTAIPASKVSIGDATLNNTDKYYYNGDTAATSTLKEGEAPNATFSDGTLTLNNLNVTNAKGIRWDSKDDSKGGSFNVNLTIKLEPYSDNTIVSTAGSAIVGDNGETANGPSLTIEGSGALHLTGKTSGIWVWKNITIAERAAVDIKAQGQTSGVSAGICNNTTGVTTIKDNAYVKIDSAKYGIAHSSSDTYKPNNDTVFTGGSLLINAGTAAMRATPTTAIEASKYDIIYNGNSIAASTYLKAESVDTYADRVYIYLRTLDKNSDKGITVPDDQLEALGIKYYYSYWVDFGSYMSVKTEAYKNVNGTVTTGRYDETVKAIVNETKAAAINKKSGITFNRLDAVTWDTLSWSQNTSGGNTWHLNGEIPLCKVKFYLNSSDKSPYATRYAVKGTDVNSRLPVDPTREGYTFGYWCTADGTEITEIPVLEDDVTYYAHWTPDSGTSYNVKLYCKGGDFAKGYSDITKYTYGTEVELPQLTKVGYIFEGWYDNDGLTGDKIEKITAMDTGDKAFWAKWTPIPAEAPIIAEQPQGLSLKYGESGTLKVEAKSPDADNYTLEYQWFVNATDSNIGGVFLTGETKATYEISNSIDVGTYYYYCIVVARRNDNREHKMVISNTAKVEITKLAGQVTAPTAKEGLTYNGLDQELIEAGSSTTGTIQYSLDGENYSTAIPKGKTVGTYEVWYKVVGDETHYDVAPAKITVKIAKAAGPAAPSGLKAVAVSEWGLADGKITGVDGTMEYADTKDADKWTTCAGTEIEGLKAGTYYVRVKATDNYEAGVAATVIVPDGENIVRAIAVSSDGYKKVYYTGEELDVVDLAITVTKSNGDTNTIPVTKEMVSGFDSSAVGNKTLTITYEGKTTTFVIKVQNRSFTGITSESYDGSYDGNAHGITVKGVPEGAQVLYGTSEDKCTESKIEYINFTNGEQTVFYKVSMNGYDDFTGSATVNITKKEATITVSDSSKTEGDADPEFSGSIAGLVEGETLDVKYGRIEADSAKEAAGDDITITATVANGDNYDIKVVEGKLTINKKTSGGHYKPTQKPEIIAGEGTKAGLTLNGTKATITVEEGYEITDVLVNGVSLGKVTEITGLKTGDKVEIKTAKKQTEPEFNISSYVKDLKLVARSSKTANKNIRVKVASVTDGNGNPVDLSELKAKGYKVKYKFYRSEKKASEYGARIEKDTDNNSYINNTGKKGVKYFYKVRVMVYDANGKLVAQSELKQCRYAVRTWSK